MKVKLLGYRNTSFKAENGDKIEGTSLFYSFPFNDKDGKGEEAEKKFVKKDSIPLPELKIGISYILEFTSKGRLMSVTAEKF